MSFVDRRYRKEMLVLAGIGRLAKVARPAARIDENDANFRRDPRGKASLISAAPPNRQRCATEVPCPRVQKPIAWFSASSSESRSDCSAENREFSAKWRDSDANLWRCQGIFSGNV